MRGWRSGPAGGGRLLGSLRPTRRVPSRPPPHPAPPPAPGPCRAKLRAGGPGRRRAPLNRGGRTGLLGTRGASPDVLPSAGDGGGWEGGLPGAGPGLVTDRRRRGGERGERSGGGRERELVGEHRGDDSLCGPWATGLWPVRARAGAEYGRFRVVMTGPTWAGGRGLCCAGFDLFGRVGRRFEPDADLRPPAGLRSAPPTGPHDRAGCHGIPRASPPSSRDRRHVIVTRSSSRNHRDYRHVTIVTDGHVIILA